jgi:hypothetical protein
METTTDSTVCLGHLGKCRVGTEESSADCLLFWLSAPRIRVATPWGSPANGLRTECRRVLLPRRPLSERISCLCSVADVV